MSAAELVGDLAVLYTELEQTPRPSTWTFGDYFCYGEALFRLAIEAGIAVAEAPEPPRAALAVLVDAVEPSRLLSELTWALHGVFSSCGYTAGYFYSGCSWEQLCWFRSGITFVASLAGIALDALDVSSIEDNMERYAADLREDELEIPPGMPAAHWWWFRGYA